jgi:DNA-binding transcriptional LysR family regulator
MALLLYSAIEGVGVAQLPTIVADEPIASGTLVDLLPEWTPAVGITQAVFPSRRGLLPSVRSLVDFLATEFAALPDVTSPHKLIAWRDGV